MDLEKKLHSQNEVLSAGIAKYRISFFTPLLIFFIHIDIA